jgi:hypothetical protein
VAPEVDPAQESIVLASFESRYAAEYMLASLGRGFRQKARKGQVNVLTAGGVGAALIRVSLAWTVGFMGLLSALRGGESFGHAVRVHEAQVGSDDQAAHAILARAGAHGAAALVCCKDAETRRTVAAVAADRGSESWVGSRTEFLARLDPGGKHDWVRAALGEPSKPD